MLRHRSFWIILVITAIVGLGTLLSEHNDYPVQIHVEWAGYDTARYSIVRADTLLPLTLNSNCFLAIGRYLEASQKHYIIHTEGDTTVKVNKMLVDDILSDFQFYGVHGFSSTTEQLTLRVAPRQAKKICPELKGVEFSFEDQCGLSGEPRLEPDTVTLYGSASSLAKIDRLYTLPQKIEGLKDSCYCTLALDPVWKKYPDLRVSDESVRLFIPIGHFTEKKFSVPVRFDCPESVDGASYSQHRARLYPDRVEVTLWVTEQDYDRVLPDMVQAAVQYDPSAPSEVLPVRITAFPSYTRVKSITPSTINYVILK